MDLARKTVLKVWSTQALLDHTSSKALGGILQEGASLVDTPHVFPCHAAIERATARDYLDKVFDKTLHALLLDSHGMRKYRTPTFQESPTILKNSSKATRVRPKHGLDGELLPKALYCRRYAKGKSRMPPVSYEGISVHAFRYR